MTKKAILLVVLSLALSARAYAGAGSVTVTCNVSDPANVITGSATVSLCSTADCTGEMVSCQIPAVACDSSGLSGPTQTTTECRTKFKARGLFYFLTFQEGIETDSITNTKALGGHGFSTSVGNMDGSVAIVVK